MSLPKVFLVVSLVLFSIIGIVALGKKNPEQKDVSLVVAKEEVDLSLFADAKSTPSPELPIEPAFKDPVVDCAQEEAKPVVIEHDPEEEGLQALFVKGSSCPIVETITYKRHVPWKHRRAAWLADYAQHYKTSLDFIYRSLNGGRGYSAVNVTDGARFNVFKKDVPFRFHLIVSISSCRLRAYYVLPKEKKAVFLKSYEVCLGKKDASKPSTCLTPLGTYSLGDRVATFRPKMMGKHKGKTIESIQVFGSYWVPFEKQIDGCTEPAKGYGIHGTPIVRDSTSGTLEEDTSSIGHYESDGCIRLSGKDMQELFSLVSTQKSFVEIVPSFDRSKLLQGDIINEEQT